MRCGIDLGSRNVKLVVMDGEKIVKAQVFETAQFYREFGRREPEGMRVDFAALALEEVDRVVATGYGRNTVDLIGAAVISELRRIPRVPIGRPGLKTTLCSIWVDRTVRSYRCVAAK